MKSQYESTKLLFADLYNSLTLLLLPLLGVICIRIVRINRGEMMFLFTNG